MKMTITLSVHFNRLRSHLELLSFPTRRSSDLNDRIASVIIAAAAMKVPCTRRGGNVLGTMWRHKIRDRKSTRLNSSHEWISYAVFCLKKKNYRQQHYQYHVKHNTHQKQHKSRH